MDASNPEQLKSQTPPPEVRRFADLAQASHQAARYIVATAQACAAAGRPFTLALAGGATPQTLYRLLAAPSFAEQLPKANTHLFWGDERCVPPQHPASNFGMSQALLLDPLGLPAAQIHRMPGETRPPAEAAHRYEQHLRQFFKAHARPARFPRFDLILLGLGVDGHTASLLPGSLALAEKEHWVVAVDGAGATPPLARLTLTLPVLNQADNVVFLVAGQAKARLVQAIIADHAAAARQYPAALVRPTGRLLYLVGEIT